MTKEEEQKVAYWRKRMLDKLQTLLNTVTPELDGIVMSSNHIRLEMKEIIPLVNAVSKNLRLLPKAIIDAKVEPLPKEEKKA